MKQELTGRAIQAMESKKKIYKTAMNLINKKGFDQVTIDEICKKAGVSKGLFYNYFPSKEELFTEFSEQINGIQPETRKAFKEGQTFWERLMIFEKNNVKLQDSKMCQDATRTAYAFALKNPGKAFYCSREREYYVLLKELVIYGQSRGEVRTDLSPEYLADYISTATWGYFFANLIGFQNESTLLESITDGFRLMYDALRPQS